MSLRRKLTETTGGKRVIVSAMAMILATTRLTAAPADGPTVELQPLQFSENNSGQAASPDSRLQEMAPETIDLTVTAVITKPLTGAGAPPGALTVTANATVLSVLRSATKLKPGDHITITYQQIPPPAGRSLPAPIPLLKEGTEYIAYLIGPVTDAYAPIAGAHSFMDPAKPSEIVLPPGIVEHGALINPKLLPMPQNPSPSGVVKMSGDRVKEWAEMGRADGKWQVLLREFKEPLPLQVIGDATPVPLAYYLKPMIAPDTQPTVLVYRAGTEESSDPALGTLTIERALIIDPKGKLLGDTVWARRTDKDVLIPLPDWHWLSFKLEVEDSMAHTIQHISLVATETASAPAAPADKK